MSSQQLHIYSDGGYFEKKDTGGWAFVIYADNKELYRHSGWQKQTSSLEMELMAALQALEHLAEKAGQQLAQLNLDKPIILFTDSRIIIEGLMDKYPIWCKNQWRVKSGKTVIYKELWQKLSKLTSELNIKWQWVKAHNGIEGNTLADALARQAMTQSIPQLNC